MACTAGLHHLAALASCSSTCERRPGGSEGASLAGCCASAVRLPEPHLRLGQLQPQLVHLILRCLRGHRQGSAGVVSTAQAPRRPGLGALNLHLKGAESVAQAGGAWRRPKELRRSCCVGRAQSGPFLASLHSFLTTLSLVLASHSPRRCCTTDALPPSAPGGQLTPPPQ